MEHLHTALGLFTLLAMFIQTSTLVFLFHDTRFQGFITWKWLLAAFLTGPVALTVYLLLTRGTEWYEASAQALEGVAQFLEPFLQRLSRRDEPVPDKTAPRKRTAQKHVENRNPMRRSFAKYLQSQGIDPATVDSDFFGGGIKLPSERLNIGS